MKISDLDFWGGALHLRLEQLLITRNEFLRANGAYLDKSPSLSAELQSIEQQISDVEGKIACIDEQLSLHERVEPKEARAVENESLPPNKRATAKRVENKNFRQTVIADIVGDSRSTGTAKDLAVKIHKAIERNPQKWGLARAPAVSTIQNDISEIKKRLNK